MSASAVPAATLQVAERRTVERLQAFEARLDPARPTAGGARIVGYGEVSTVFAVPGLDGVVCKRMAGFHDDGKAAAYVDVVARYIGELRTLGLAVVDTGAVPVHTPASGPVVYLVQPRVATAELGHHVLRDAGDDTLLELYLKLRRFDRFVRTRVLRQRYNFILPGPVRR